MQITYNDSLVYFISCLGFGGSWFDYVQGYLDHEEEDNVFITTYEKMKLVSLRNIIYLIFSVENRANSLQNSGHCHQKIVTNLTKSIFVPLYVRDYVLL